MINRQDAVHYRIEAAKCHQAANRTKDLASRLHWEQRDLVDRWRNVVGAGDHKGDRGPRCRRPLLALSATSLRRMRRSVQVGQTVAAGGRAREAARTKRVAYSDIRPCPFPALPSVTPNSTDFLPGSAIAKPSVDKPRLINSRTADARLGIRFLNRLADRTGVAQARRLDLKRRRLPSRARRRSAGRILAAAHGAEALCRRQSQPRRLCLLWQSGDAIGKPALPRRPRRPRRASGLRRRRGPVASGGTIRRHQIPAEDTDAGDLRRQQNLQRRHDRTHDFRRRSPAGLHPSRHVRARQQRS